MRRLQTALSWAPLACALVLAAPARVAAQDVVVDTIQFVVSGRIATIRFTGPRSGYVGDTLRVQVVTLDSEGDRVPALLSWEVSDTTLADWTATSDSTGYLVLRAKGTLEVVITAVEITRLSVWIQDPADGVWKQNVVLTVGDTAQLCAVGFQGDRAVGATRPDCPVAGGTAGAHGVPVYRAELLAMLRG